MTRGKLPQHQELGQAQWQQLVLSTEGPSASGPPMHVDPRGKGSSREAGQERTGWRTEAHTQATGPFSLRISTPRTTAHRGPRILSPEHRGATLPGPGEAQHHPSIPWKGGTWSSSKQAS